MRLDESRVGCFLFMSPVISQKLGFRGFGKEGQRGRGEEGTQAFMACFRTLILGCERLLFSTCFYILTIFPSCLFLAEMHPALPDCKACPLPPCTRTPRDGLGGRRHRFRPLDWPENALSHSNLGEYRSPRQAVTRLAGRPAYVHLQFIRYPKPAAACHAASEVHVGHGEGLPQLDSPHRRPAAPRPRKTPSAAAAIIPIYAQASRIQCQWGREMKPCALSSLLYT